jgi:surface carbohydrate biosynthesis protein
MLEVKGVVCIAIETISREETSKMLLANFLVAANYAVFVGSKSAISDILSHTENFSLYEKSSARSKEGYFESIKNRGHSIFINDEEGLIYFNKDIYLHRRLSKTAYEFVDRFYCWGNDQKKILNEWDCNDSKKTLLTGNPRIDLLREDFSYSNKKISSIKKKLGSFILINTKFGYSNNKIGFKKFIKDNRRSGVITKVDDLKNRISYYHYQKKLQKYFVEMILQISEKNPDTKLVVRPHPSENVEYWNRIFKKNNNIIVDSSGEAYVWIKAASVVIHNGCTTAIEAILEKNTMVISYEPFNSGIFSIDLPSKVSIRVKTVEAILDLIDKRQDPSPVSSDKFNISEYVHIDTDSYSSQMIANDIDSYLEEKNNNKKLWIEIIKLYPALLKNSIKQTAYRLIYYNKVKIHYISSRKARSLSRWFNKMFGHKSKVIRLTPDLILITPSRSHNE